MTPDEFEFYHDPLRTIIQKLRLEIPRQNAEYSVYLSRFYDRGRVEYEGQHYYVTKIETVGFGFSQNYAEVVLTAQVSI